jgi:hypothetical protein
MLDEKLMRRHPERENIDSGVGPCVMAPRERDATIRAVFPQPARCRSGESRTGLDSKFRSIRGERQVANTAALRFLLEKDSVKVEFLVG